MVVYLSRVLISDYQFSENNFVVQNLLNIMSTVTKQNFSGKTVEFLPPENKFSERPSPYRNIAPT